MSIFAPRSTYWTAEEDRQLRILWLADWSTLSIAVTIGRSKSAVCGRARRIGLPRRESPIPTIIDPGKIARFRHECALADKAWREELARAA